MEKEIVGSTPTPATNAGKLKKTTTRFNLFSLQKEDKMWLPKIKNMDEFDKAAWRGFLIGVGITVLTLAPFVLLVIGYILSGYHIHTEMVDPN